MISFQGVGGVFVLKNGNATQHVTPDFVEEGVHDVSRWLKFYSMPGPLVGVGTFITDVMDLNFKLEHFHTFSQSIWGGHYYNDTTPDTTEYEAYFNVAQQIIRIDRPIDNAQ